MDKKRLMYPVFLLILLIVGFYLTINVNAIGFVGRADYPSQPVMTNATTGIQAVYNLSFIGPLGTGQAFTYTELKNWTRGRSVEEINFTINISEAPEVNNINITLPSNLPANSNISIIPNGVNITFVNGSSSTIGPILWNATIVHTSSSITASFFPRYNVTANYNVTNMVALIRLLLNVTKGDELIHNWTITVSNGSSTDAGYGVRTGSDGIPPRMISMNITDGVHTITSGYTTSSALSNSSEVNISIVVEDYNVDRVLLIYNNTGGIINITAVRNQIYSNVSVGYNISSPNQDAYGGTINGIVLGDREYAVKVTGNNTVLFAQRSSFANTTAIRPEFKFNLSDWSISSSSGTFSWAFVVYDLYNHTEIINNSNSNFQVTNDPSVPTASITEPSTLSIRTTNSVTYKCTCGDSQSSIKTCTTTLTKPSGAATSKTGSATDLIFTGDDTNEAGEYTVTCKAVNYVDLSTTVTATNKLLVSTASSSSTGGTSGGSSGGEATQVISEEVTAGTTKDIGTFTETQITQISEQGSVSFKVGTETHTAKVLTVGTDSVTIEVSSTPKQVTLTIGETKDVDTNDDGTDDISISLNAITNGKADITFKNLATSGGTEEISTTTTITQPPVVTGTEPTSKAWIWWTLIAVIIIVIVVLLLRKKK